MSTARRRPAKPKPSDIESILDQVEAPQTSVTLCLKGNLRAEYERLEAHLEGLATDPVNLAGEGPATEVARQLEDLREQMLAHERTFTLRAVTPSGAWRKLAGKRPVKTPDLDDEQYGESYHGWLCEVVAASAANPAMTPAQVTRLADKLSNGQWAKLANAAWSVNDDSRGIPFSAAASVLSRSSGVRSQQPERSANPGHGSLAGNPEPSPSTSTDPTGS